MEHRKINGIAVSPLALGTMRFADRDASASVLVNLFSFLYDELGIDVHHSSYEYNSYSLYCDALDRFKKKARLA